jgi:hypothetical protein
MQLRIRHSSSVNTWRSPAVKIWLLPTYFCSRDRNSLWKVNDFRSYIKYKKKLRDLRLSRTTRFRTRIPELEKSLESVYRQWTGVLWRRYLLLCYKITNKCFRKKVSFLSGQNTYALTLRLCGSRVSLKKCAFWDGSPCGSYKNRRFGGT